MANVPMDRPCKLTVIVEFKKVLNLDIYVFAAQLNNKVLYPNEDRRPRQKRVYLYLTKNGDSGHFDAITSEPGFLGARYLVPYLP